MKKVAQIVLFLLILTGISCSRQDYQTRQKEKRAEREMADLRAAIMQNNLDSVWLISQRSSDIHYLVYYRGNVVFWSDNSLTAPNIYSPREGGWFNCDFANASCRVLWQRVGEYDVEIIIPLEWNIGAKEEIAQSFSYQPLSKSSSHSQARVFFWLIIATIAALIIAYVVLLIRAGGYNNLRQSTKVSLAFMTVTLLAFVAVVFVSEQYIRNRKRQRQELELKQKAQYIQASLQNIYLYPFSINDINATSLHYILRDLAHTYGTDIHIYDLKGHLYASSSPQLFQQRLLSTYLAPEVLFAPDKTMTCFSTLGDFRYLSAYTEFVNSAFLQLGYIAVPSFISEEEAAQEVDKFLAWLLPVFLLAIVIGIATAIVLSRILTADFDLRYNNMVAELERSSRQLARSEREGAWRTMARQIAHEINNPLTPMKLTVQQLQRLKGTERFDAQFDKAAAMLISEMDNLSRIATSFSTFAKQPEVEPGEVDVAQKLSAAVTLCSNNPQGTPIRYFGPDSEVMVRADKEQIGQVFTNIIRNAVQAINSAPEGDIIVILKNDAASQYIEISISDNGPGISEDVQPKIFLPNFTTKSTGAGLGLAISKNIVEGADGKITFETSPQGTTFHIFLLRV